MPNEDHKNTLSDAKFPGRADAKDPSGLRRFGDETSSRGIIRDDAIAWAVTAIFYVALGIWIMTG